MLSALKRQLIHTIKIRKLDAAGYAVDGGATYSAAVTAAAYVEVSRRQWRHPTENLELTTETTVILETPEVTKDDLLFLHGVDATDINNGKKPRDVLTFFVPGQLDSGQNPIVDHYEVKL